MAVAGGTLSGSSHREAPGIAKTPKVDGTDFYMFRSYEPGRANYVTLLANYIGLEDGYGGPNFFTLDDDAVYEIHVDNNGNGVEDLTFQFQFQKTQKNLAVPVGDKMTAVPLINIGGIGPGRDDTGNLNVLETYTLNIVRGGRRTGQRQAITDAATGSTTFKKPVDRIGDKSLRDNSAAIYDQYADNHIYNINIPGCSAAGRVFVGQRREGFVVNLGEVFDLVNLNPLGPENGEENTLADKNVTTLALEVPISCLVGERPDHRGLDDGEHRQGHAGLGLGRRCDGSTATAARRALPRRRRPSPSFVPTQDCNGWVPAESPASPRQLGQRRRPPQGRTGHRRLPGRIPEHAPSRRRTSCRPQDCLGWVPPNHPAARTERRRRRTLHRRPVHAGVAARSPAGERSRHRPARQGQVQRQRAERRRAVRAVRDASVAAGPDPGALRRDRRRRCRATTSSSVFLTGVTGLNKPANVSAGRDAAAEHRHRGHGRGRAEPSRRDRRRQAPASRTAAVLATTWSTSRCASSRAS